MTKTKLNMIGGRKKGPGDRWGPFLGTGAGQGFGPAPVFGSIFAATTAPTSLRSSARQVPCPIYRHPNLKGQLLRLNPTKYSTSIMPHRILDATDISRNAARFCQPCREMFGVRQKGPKLVESLRVSRGCAFSKGSGYQHPQLWVPGNEDTKCELCIFLRVELGDGPDTPLPKNYGFIKAFALPGKQGPMEVPRNLRLSSRYCAHCARLLDDSLLSCCLP